MILTCPECDTRYLLPKDDQIGPSGRTVRCAKCQTSWYVSSDLDELILKDNQAAEIDLARRVQKASEQVTVAPKAPDTTQHVSEIENIPTQSYTASPGAHVEIRDRADRRRRKFRLSIIGLIWGLTLGGIAVTVGLAYLMRQEVITRYPPAAVLYKAFGIEVSQEGLEFENLTTRTVFIDGNPVLVINGQVKNITTQTVPLPLIAFSLHDSAKTPLAEWRVEFSETELAEGKSTKFVAQYPNPSLDAVSLLYGFDDGRQSLLLPAALGVVGPNGVEPNEIEADGLKTSGEGETLSTLPTPRQATPRDDIQLRREPEPIPMIVED